MIHLFMPEYKKPITEKEYKENFSQIHPVMNTTEAAYESARCLFCYDAPCINACPTSIDIPLFIRQINTGNVTGAAKTIYDANYLGNACGKVCPTEVLCEGACVYNHQDVPPIDIGRLQNFATQHAIEHDTPLFTKAASNGVKVAVIGAGPGGLACACELSSQGYEVTVYEAKSKGSGLILHGVAPYKITNEESLEEVEYLQRQFGFDIIYNEPIASADQIKTLEATYKAIFLGIGLGNTNRISLSGENLQNCFGATEFIEDLKINQEKTLVGKNVVVLGGGNTAMDAASESARMGAENVYLVYRRGIDQMGAYAFEYDLAKNVGVKGLFNLSPHEIYGNGKVEGIKFLRTTEKNGVLSLEEGSEFEVACDMVILATGQSKQKEFLSKLTGVEIDEKGKILISENGRCGNGQYFAGGDAVNGGMEVVNAVADGKLAAKGIHNFLNHN